VIRKSYLLRMFCVPWLPIELISLDIEVYGKALYRLHLNINFYTSKGDS
jgi:hypothetical protein